MEVWDIYDAEDDELLLELSIIQRSPHFTSG
jgi:hypothetical protein